MRALKTILLLTFMAAAVGCGIKPELPDQTPFTGGISEGDYSLEYRWTVTGVTDMVVGRDSGIFYVIQDSDSLGIYPAYRRANAVLEGRQLFPDLIEPTLLCEGLDFDRRIWIYDEADGKVKGFDGNEFLNELSVIMEFHDPAWRDVVAIAADDDRRIFVADRGPNRIYRYKVEGEAGDFEILTDGEISWTSQGGGATVRDLAFANGFLLLLDDVLLTLQILDPETGSQNPAVFTYLDGFLDQPAHITGDGDAIFVTDRANNTVWAIDWDLNMNLALRINAQDDDPALVDPVAMTVNEGKLYVADPELGKILDYEKR
ncbi:hypothetical protein H8E52_01675 [bacterium]|nr:hypothetical protein [bacterium]